MGKTDEREFEYEVAFSFLAADEDLATKINDLIQDRVATFLFSKRQGELVGTDGEKEFDSVFGSKARIVVVLYRESWGKTPWTMIEETAIRNRAFVKGYDFTIFIPLDAPPAVPEWLPKNRIWFSLDRWGVDGAASVIEERVNQAGGNVRPESIEDKADRLKRGIAFDEKRTRFLNSEEGVQAAQEEFRKLSSEIKRICNDIADPAARMDFKVDIHEADCSASTSDYILCLHWGYPLVNTLQDSRLRVTLCEDTADLRRMMVKRVNPYAIDDCEDTPDSYGTMVSFEPLHQVEEMELHFDLTASGATGWRNAKGEKRFFQTPDLAEHCLGLFIECIRRRRLGNE